MIDQEAVDRVGQGAELLDREYPQWWEEVHLDILDLGSSNRCVLGQLYGEYWHGLGRLHLDYTTSPLYGFDAGASEEDEHIIEYEDLQKAWIGEIEDRLLIEGR